MAHANKVTRSIETPDGGRCVDLFRRPGASFGFAEYHRDPEDPSGWFPIGFHTDSAFPTAAPPCPAGWMRSPPAPSAPPLSS